MPSNLNDNAERAGEFVAEPTDEAALDAVIPQAVRGLIDWVGVAIAGRDEVVVQRIARYAGLQDQPPPLCMANDPERAALVNGAAAHALDFDDTFIPADTHFSAVTLAACFALATPDTTTRDFLRAYVVGYEVAAKLAGRRFGFALQFRWLHPTAVLGRIAAAAASASLLRLSAPLAAHALALAATTATGLRSGHGSMVKPLQVGEAARDGVRSALLARSGVEAPGGLLEPTGGLARAFVQDGKAALADLRVTPPGEDWAVFRNSFKPYACLHGIHPSIDAARAIAPLVAPSEVRRVRVFVAPGVKQVARFERPETVLEAKFSVHACVAMALAGYEVGARDFVPRVLGDADVRAIGDRVEVVAVEGRKMLDSAVEVTENGGRIHHRDVPLALGHPGNPMSDAMLEHKFRSLVDGRTDVSQCLLSTLRSFAGQADLRELMRAFRAD